MLRNHPMAHRGGGGRVWTRVSGVLVRRRRGFRTDSHVVEIAGSSFQTPNHMIQLIHHDTILILDTSHWHNPQNDDDDYQHQHQH